ncbi:unnamed protein product, partial [Ectocarpus sp. 6 AP-2014]
MGGLNGRVSLMLHVGDNISSSPLIMAAVEAMVVRQSPSADEYHSKFSTLQNKPKLTGILHNYTGHECILLLSQTQNMKQKTPGHFASTLGHNTSVLLPPHCAHLDENLPRIQAMAVQVGEGHPRPLSYDIM